MIERGLLHNSLEDGAKVAVVYSNHPPDKREVTLVHLEVTTKVLALWWPDGAITIYRLKGSRRARGHSPWCYRWEMTWMLTLSI